MTLSLSSIPALQVLNVCGDCTVGRTDQEAISLDSVPGLYIDRLNPASCSGNITEWNFCYFNPRRFHNRSSVQIHFQVWRFDSAVQRAVRVAEHVDTISIPEKPEEFQCETITLDQDRYISITEGDHLGVQLLAKRVLPVVGNSSEPRDAIVFVHGSLFLPTEVNLHDPGTLNLSNHALHVSATIGKDKLAHFYF